MPLPFSYAIFVFVALFFCTKAVRAQKSGLQVKFSNDHLEPTEKLDFVATYKLGDKELPPATLAVVMKENNGDGIWQMRWPMVDGYAEASLTFPPEIKKGNYTFYFVVEPRFFQVAGQILYPSGIKKLNADIYAPSIQAKHFEIPVDNKGEFKMNQYLFQNTATLEFVLEQTKKMPAIRVDVMLDSTFEAAAFEIKEITIGTDKLSTIEYKKIDNWMIYFDPFYPIKKLGNLSPIQKFDSIYVSALFKNALQQFDCLDNTDLEKSKSLNNFLDKDYPGFTIDDAFSDDKVATAHARGNNFTLYLNEMPVNFGVLNNIKLSDIAFIKVLPTFVRPIDPAQKPQFILALYTKQGPFVMPDYYRYKYVINGYQPRNYQLPPNPKMVVTNPYVLQ